MLVLHSKTRNILMAVWLLALALGRSNALTYPPSGSEPQIVLPNWWQDGPNSIVFAPDSATLTTISRGGVVVWNAETGAYHKTLSQADGPLLAGSPDGQLLAVSYDWEPIVQLLDAHTGAIRCTLRVSDMTERDYFGYLYLTCLVFSPDGRTLATVAHGTERLWDVETGRQRKTQFKPNSPIGTIAFSPDGKTFAVGEGGLPPRRWTPGADNRRYFPQQALLFCQLPEPEPIKPCALELYSIRDGAYLRRIATVPNEISDLRFLPDGKSLAYIQGAELELRDVRSGNLRWRKEDCRGLEVSPTGTTIAAFGREWMSLLDVRTGHPRRAFSQSGYFGMVAFAPNERTLATGGSLDTYGAPICLRLWDTRTGLLKANLREPVGYGDRHFWSVLTADEKRLVIANAEGRIDTWFLQSGTLHTSQISPALVSQCLLSSDGKTVLEETRAVVPPYVSQWARSSLRLRDCRTGKILKRFYDNQEALAALAWSADGMLAATTRDRYTSEGKEAPNADIWIWDVRRTRKSFRLVAPMPGVERMFFSRDGRSLVSVSRTWIGPSIPTDRVEAAIWDLSTHRLIRSILLKQESSEIEDKLPGLTFDNCLMIVHIGKPEEDASIQIQDLLTGHILREWKIPKQITREAKRYEMGSGFFSPPISEFELSDDGKTFATSATFRLDTLPTVEETIRVLYDVATGHLLYTTPVNEKLFFLNNGRCVGVGFYGPDILESTTGTLLASVYRLPPVGSWIAITPDNRYDGSPDVQRYVNWSRYNLVYSSNWLTQQRYQPSLLPSVLMDPYRAGRAEHEISHWPAASQAPQSQYHGG